MPSLYASLWRQERIPECQRNRNLRIRFNFPSSKTPWNTDYLELRTQVSGLSLGAATFGGSNEFFGAWGKRSREARRLVDICLEAGVNLFDTADGYSDGLSEEVLGAAIEGRRDQVLISTKAYFPIGPGPNDRGTSRHT